ncbi:hypothetical protein [Burkholderia glumae]|uniref:hypothetical protein n=1 Tax=Burkholderia glumae TaxID=337 RepID=UPI0012D30A13|nr:hypothetical protein [Burkholderia glumae]
MMSGDCNIPERRKRFYRKHVALFLAFSLIGWGLIAKVAQAAETYEIAGKSLRIVNSGAAHLCSLDAKPLYAVASYDQSAVIISERGYVKKEDLDDCRPGNPVHVHLIPVRLGFLSDINISKGIYVALDFVGARPFRYLATVAHIGSSKNLVAIDGAYIPGKSLSLLRTHAFSASGEAGTSLISPDGRFVAPDGVVSCAGDSFPGVWDIANNKKVILDDSSCSALFDLGRR